MGPQHPHRTPKERPVSGEVALSLMFNTNTVKSRLSRVQLRVSLQEKRKMASIPNGSAYTSDTIKEVEHYTGPELQRTGRSVGCEKMTSKAYWFKPFYRWLINANMTLDQDSPVWGSAAFLSLWLNKHQQTLNWVKACQTQTFSTKGSKYFWV